MSRYLLVGDTIADAIEVTDSSGAYADPGAGPTCTVTLPSGSTAAATVTKTATGKFTATYASTTAGIHRFTWAATGTNSSDFPHVSVFIVNALDRFIIGLDDARDALNLPASARVTDPEIMQYVAATTTLVEGLIGPVLPATRKVVMSGAGLYRLPLPEVPSAVTVVEDGVTLTEGSDYVLDEFGLLWRGSSAFSATWSSTAPGNVTVTMTVGDATIDPAVVLAARELVRFAYQVGQQASRPAFNSQIAGADLGLTLSPRFAVPDNVIDKLMAVQVRRDGDGRAMMKAPGIA